MGSQEQLGPLYISLRCWLVGREGSSREGNRRLQVKGKSKDPGKKRDMWLMVRRSPDRLWKASTPYHTSFTSQQCAFSNYEAFLEKPATGMDFTSGSERAWSSEQKQQYMAQVPNTPVTMAHMPSYCLYPQRSQAGHHCRQRQLA